MVLRTTKNMSKTCQKRHVKNKNHKGFLGKRNDKEALKFSMSQLSKMRRKVFRGTIPLLVGGLVAIFYFPRNIGFLIIPIDFHFFQSGSNHQPDWIMLHLDPLMGDETFSLSDVHKTIDRWWFETMIYQGLIITHVDIYIYTYHIYIYTYVHIYIYTYIYKYTYIWLINNDALTGDCKDCQNIWMGSSNKSGVLNLATICGFTTV